MSITSQPLLLSRLITLSRMRAPELRPSEPMTILPLFVYVAKAPAKESTTSSVNDSPVIPRIPEMLILSVIRKHYSKKSLNPKQFQIYKSKVQISDGFTFERCILSGS
jgi:hypothetical protein